MKLCNLSIKVLSEKKIIVYIEHLIAEYITNNVKKVDVKPLIPPFLVYPLPPPFQTNLFFHFQQFQSLSSSHPIRMGCSHYVLWVKFILYY